VRRLLGLFVLASVGAAMLPPALVAQSGAQPAAAEMRGDPSRLSGRFVRDAAASDDVPAAIERAVAQMSLLTRAIGRSRLRATNQPPADVRFALPPDSVVVHYAGQPEFRARRDGSPREWRNTAGEPFEARATLSAATDGRVVLRQSFSADDGRRENTWTLDATGTALTLDVQVSSPRLPQPLRYRHVFRRAP
jgi:hypothetical protein